jgi:anti-sigma regulatory factor (Ser/Thr protein kinase)
MQAHLQLTFAPMWPNVREIRQRVGAALEECPAQLRSAAIMTASELVENAIKYGESVPAAKTVTFVLEATSESLLIQVVNGSTNAVGVAELERRVQELRSAEDKQALYLARLEQLLANAEESGKLGIYRIGFEGGFDLELEFENDVVTVTATRKANANANANT